MRTTLTLDDELYRALADRAKALGAPLERVLDDALRAGLGLPRGPRSADGPRRRFEVTPLDLELRPGVDPARLKQFLAPL